MRPLILGFLLLSSLRLYTAEGDALGDLIPPSKKNNVAAASSSSGIAAAMKKIVVAPSFKIEPFATEPDIQNVVNFCFDEKGNAYVVESHRRRTSVFDIRGLTPWLDEDFALRTVEDRANFLQRHLNGSDADFLAASAQSPRHGGVQDFNHDGMTNWHDLEVESERIRFLKVRDGQVVGVATFADGFNSVVSGVAAGVLARGDKLWFTCIPDLWVFTNSIAGTRSDAGAVGHEHGNKLISGFGVHVALGGHDMHGLKFGPDGKLYWSIADRGTSTNLFSKLTKPFPGLTPELLANAGAVFRANPDGSEFEVFAIGLRNPQELAFDDFGNLFTGDNNADGGDKARWEHVVEGADYGWRIGYQWLPKLGAWNSEMLWGLAASNTAAYLIPPVAHISHGPAGMVHYPGTGMPERFADNFFLADFPGGVRYFKMKPKGAGFTVENPGEYLLNNSPEKSDGKLMWNAYPTDVDFGTEGGVYVSDWVEGWEKTGKGRIWRVYEPESVKQPIVAETKKLLAEGMEKRPAKELAQLMGHVDQRVRLSAQFALAERVATDKSAEVKLLVETALTAKNRMTRLHAVWALGQVGHKLPENQFVAECVQLLPLLRDGDDVIRGAAAGMFSRAAFLNSLPEIAALCGDKSPVVRFSAATAICSFSWLKSGGNRLHQSATEQISETVGNQLDRTKNRLGMGNGTTRGTKAFQWRFPLDEAKSMLVNANDSGDAMLRHAGVLLLVQYLQRMDIHSNGISLLAESTVAKFAGSDRSSVRLGLVLALRRLHHPEIAVFLKDSDAQIVLETARAIYEENIVEALPALAALAGEGRDSSWKPADASGGFSRLRAFTLRRALNANFRLGAPENARALAELAARSDMPESLRIEGLEDLASWGHPPGRDPVIGLWRPLPERDARIAAAALRERLPAFSDSATGRVPASEAIRIAAIQTAAKLSIVEAGDWFATVVKDTQVSAKVRLEALKGLSGLTDSRLGEVVQLALTDKNAALRSEAASLQTKLKPGNALDQIAKTLETSSLIEQQSALKNLAALDGAENIISSWLDRLVSGKLSPALQLDLLEAAAKRPSPEIKIKLDQFEAQRAANDPLARFRECLTGGDASIGRQIFYERQEASCFRCHKINGEGGDVGPDLTGVGTRKPRDYLLESMVLPNAQIAQGFESAVVTLKSGIAYAGVLKSEEANELVLNSSEDGILKLKKNEIAKRERGLSPMPEGLGEVLSRRDLRDLVEFLAQSK